MPFSSSNKNVIPKLVRRLFDHVFTVFFASGNEGHLRECADGFAAHSDVVEPGAYRDTLNDWKGKGRLPAMLLQHAMGSLTQDQLPIGIWTHMAEDSRDSTSVEAGVYTLMKMQPHPAISGLSIGYRATKFTKHAPGQMLDGRRRTLHSVHLGEISLVTDPSCDPARITAVKGADAGDRVTQALRKLQAMLST